MINSNKTQLQSRLAGVGRGTSRLFDGASRSTTELFLAYSGETQRDVHISTLKRVSHLDRSKRASRQVEFEAPLQSRLAGVGREGGFVSIIVCMIIMTILSLITIGFAQIMAREQRQALDRQLSSQAFYAAESGVNDALINIGGYNPSICSPAYSISADDSVRNTCITASNVVPDIPVQQVTPNLNDPRVFPIRTTPSLPATLSITWSASSTPYGATYFRPGNIDLPAQAGWGANTGALKVYLIPFSNNMSRKGLISAMGELVLIPNNAGGAPTIAYSDFSGSANYGLVRSVGCDGGTNSCTAYINGLPAYDDLYLVVTSLYQTNNILIDATDSSNGSLNFNGVQAIVDSTGKTSDVVRRIQIRQPLLDSFTIPAGALQATDPEGICKLLTASPSPTGSSAGAGCSF